MPSRSPHRQSLVPLAELGGIDADRFGAIADRLAKELKEMGR
jgi:hypothetical protein